MDLRIPPAGQPFKPVGMPTIVDFTGASSNLAESISRVFQQLPEQLLICCLAALWDGGQ